MTVHLKGGRASITYPPTPDFILRLGLREEDCLQAFLRWLWSPAVHRLRGAEPRSVHSAGLYVRTKLVSDVTIAPAPRRHSSM